jgi:hypothetical protein
MGPWPACGHRQLLRSVQLPHTQHDGLALLTSSTMHDAACVDASSNVVPESYGCAIRLIANNNDVLQCNDGTAAGHSRCSGTLP